VPLPPTPVQQGGIPGAHGGFGPGPASALVPPAPSAIASTVIQIASLRQAIRCLPTRGPLADRRAGGGYYYSTSTQLTLVFLQSAESWRRSRATAISLFAPTRRQIANRRQCHGSSGRRNSMRLKEASDSARRALELLQPAVP
jgi:hypothetical protein